MARALTQAQAARRAAIIHKLRASGAVTGSGLRSYLAHHKRIFVTVDTVQRDLRAMEAEGTVKRVRRTWAQGIIYGLTDGTD